MLQRQVAVLLSRRGVQSALGAGGGCTRTWRQLGYCAEGGVCNRCCGSWENEKTFVHLRLARRPVGGSGHSSACCKRSLTVFASLKEQEQIAVLLLDFHDRSGNQADCFTACPDLNLQLVTWLVFLVPQLPSLTHTQEARAPGLTQ